MLKVKLVTGGLGLELCLRLDFSGYTEWGVGSYVGADPRKHVGRGGGTKPGEDVSMSRTSCSTGILKESAQGTPRRRPHLWGELGYLHACLHMSLGEGCWGGQGACLPGGQQ